MRWWQSDVGGEREQVALPGVDYAKGADWERFGACRAQLAIYHPDLVHRDIGMSITQLGDIVGGAVGSHDDQPGIAL